jgi:hypothetical protein
MPKYPFLSDEWVAEARRIYAEAASVLPGGTPAPVRVNLIVTEAPFSDEPINAHVDTSDGTVAIGSGHLPDPDVTVSTDYLTARSLFVAGDTQALMQAFLAGRLRVDGNLAKLLDPSSGIWPNPPAGATGASRPEAAVEGTPLARTQQQLHFAPDALRLASMLQEMTE